MTAFALFALLTGPTPPVFVAYTPSELDPRAEANHRLLKTSSIRADLTALRPHFDGLVLYAYHEATTPRVLAVAKELGYRAVLLGVWDPKSAAELDGVGALARQYEKDFALGVLVGNEGVTFQRYEAGDLPIAAARLRRGLPAGVPVSTSEPLVGYKLDAVTAFGDFLCPNIHPVFDRPNLPPVEAAKWARDEAVALAARAKRPVVLKETGFPHGGKDAYTPAAQKAFWEAYTKPGLLAKGAGPAWAYFGAGFEAFDLPWKAAESGLGIERHWGLFSQGREPYPAAAVWKAPATAGRQP